MLPEIPTHTHTHMSAFSISVCERRNERERESGDEREDETDGWMDGVKEDKNARVSEIDTVYRADRSRIP